MTDFETFYITWYTRVKHFARTYVISESEAENITQDVFLTIYEKQIFLDQNVNIVGYLFTSIKNRCLDFLRKELYKQDSIAAMEVELELTLKLNYEALDDFDSNLLNSGESIEDVLNKALNKLPQKCRQIFIMNKIEGKRQKDIAAELNISINTVETQMGIAYKKLREDLKDYIPLIIFLSIIN